MADRSRRTPAETSTPRADGSGHGTAHEPPGHGEHGRGEGGHGGDDHEHEHESRWPLVAAAGAAGLYSGIAIAILGAAAGVVPPLVGVGLAGLGTIVLLAGVVGWVNEAFLEPTRARRGGEHESRESYVTTTLLFLATDVSTFSALFIYYFFLRIGAPWPPAEAPSLLRSIVLVNTLILLASSVTFHYGHEALQRGNRRRFLTLLGTTLALGLVFLGGQAYEYYEFVVHDDFTLATGVFGSAFYGLTGLHGLHVTLGVGGLAVLFWRGLRGHYGPDRDTSVETVGLYWHFVDAVWVFLVLVVYVGTAL